MDDNLIIDLYYKSSQQAIIETKKKYSNLCRSIGFNILHNEHDVDECEQDTYIQLWKTIPPCRPLVFSAYISKIARNISLKKLRYYKQKKRNAEIESLYSELCECIPSKDNVDDMIDQTLITQLINDFLKSLDEQTQVLFIRRYFYMESVNSLAKRFNLTSSNVSTKLNRVRKKLKDVLMKEGVTYD